MFVVHIFATPSSHNNVKKGFVTNVLSFYVIVAGAVQAQAGREQLLELLQQAVRPVWYHTIMEFGRLNSARHARMKGVKLVQTWMKLGETLGLDEETGKKEYERAMKREARLCAWKACQYNKTPCSISTRTCAGCGETVCATRVHVVAGILIAMSALLQSLLSTKVWVLPLIRRMASDLGIFVATGRKVATRSVVNDSSPKPIHLASDAQLIAPCHSPRTAIQCTLFVLRH